MVKTMTNNVNTVSGSSSHIPLPYQRIKNSLGRNGVGEAIQTHIANLWETHVKQAPHIHKLPGLVKYGIGKIQVISNPRAFALPVTPIRFFQIEQKETKDKLKEVQHLINLKITSRSASLKSLEESLAKVEKPILEQLQPQQSTILHRLKTTLDHFPGHKKRARQNKIFLEQQRAYFQQVKNDLDATGQLNKKYLAAITEKMKSSMSQSSLDDLEESKNQLRTAIQNLLYTFDKTTTLGRQLFSYTDNIKQLLQHDEGIDALEGHRNTLNDQLRKIKNSIALQEGREPDDLSTTSKSSTSHLIGRQVYYSPGLEGVIPLTPTSSSRSSQPSLSEGEDEVFADVPESENN